MANITITIKSKVSSPKSEVQSSNKGILPPAKNDDFIGRRRKPAQGKIRFYDLGQFLSGLAYEDVIFQVIPDWVLISIPFVRDLNAGDFEQRDALCLNLDIAQARPIARAHGAKFQGSVYGDGFEEILSEENPNWTDQGLQLSDSAFSSAGFTLSFNQVFFQSLTLTGSGKNKITSIPNADAPVAAFLPKAGDEYYLVPAIAESSGSFDTHDEIIDYPRFIYQLNHFYMFAPRDGFLGAVETDHKTLPGARSMTTTQTAFAGEFSHSPGAAGGFPKTGVFPFGAKTTPAGFLLAVIKQNSQAFYVWS